jgi:hypothetical protein
MQRIFLLSDRGLETPDPVSPPQAATAHQKILCTMYSYTLRPVAVGDDRLLGKSNRNAISDGIRSPNRGQRFPLRCEKRRGRKVTPLRIGPAKGVSINRYPSTSSGRTVNLNHVLGYNTSGSSTLFFRFGRTHITPG